MKIVELRFKNINSLYGEWCIDFRDPVFAADGLFAITGPTGSGKTTILDALCLALYGQTPRLGKMTASDNEVMSRQTGECFAEVLFESGRGLFRATWHQHRSRNRAGEKLQAPKRELSNEQGELLAEKLKDVQEMVDEITGMGFDRFTRSILLAQGSFDAFLKANADDRSPLLEQITGTGIYSDISCAVHRRNSEENQRLSELKASLGGIQLLTGEELEQLERERKEVDERYVVEAQRRDAAQASLDHTKRLQALEQAVAETRLEQARCAEAWQAFGPEAQKLADARRAGPLEVEQVTLVNLRNRLQRIGQEKSQSEAALPALIQQLAIAREKGARAEAMLKEKAAEQQTMAPLLRQVREVDTQWGERSEMLKKAVASHQEQCKELEALQEREIGAREQLKRQQGALIEAEAYQRDHAQDAELVAQLTALLQRLDHVNGLEAEEQKSRDAVELATLRARTAAQKAEATLRRLSEAGQGLKEAEEALNTAETQLAGALDEKSFDAWRTRLMGLKRRFELERQLAEMRQQVDQKGGEAKQLSDELLSLKEKQVILQRERSLLLKNLQLRQKIESLEEERRLLVDGEACPLCGAREHPFSEGLPAPESGDLDRTNVALEALLESMHALTERKCSAEALVQALRPVIAQGEEERIGLPEGRPEELEQIIGRIDQIDKAMARQVEVKKLVEQQRDAFSKAQLAGQAADQLAASEAEKLALAQGVLNEKSAACSVARADLIERLTPYGLVEFAEAAEQLKARRDAWVEMERQAQVLKAAIVKTETELEGQRDLLEVKRSGCAKLAEELTAKVAELDGLRARRVALFGDRLPDEVEKGLEEALEKSRSDWERAQLECSEMHQACQRVEQRIESLQRDFSESGEALSQAEQSFVHLLAEAGFTDEAGWQAARLDGPALSRLEARMEGLKQQRATLSALIDDKMRQLQTEREKQFPDTSEEALHELVERCNQLQQQLGTFKSRLEQNKTALALHQHKLAEVAKQQVECGRWNRLHELIGSADGKKFRNFAQGLTFELMVSHANRQLAKMSDRYLLIRDLEQPLDLNVVDNFQAGEIRPVKNLSGGESFIVSLSLALGLSKMASKAVRVDSLFLDEGFGTLDEDALETALEALSELKQDGKIIGVISHVEALKERIATQINVRVGSGGRSRLTGAGVTGGSVLAASA